MEVKQLQKKEHESIFKKVYSRTATKLIPQLQPEHGFCRQNRRELGQIQASYVNENLKTYKLP